MNDIPKLIAKMRLYYHANMLDVNNVLNQLHIISDKTANERNRKHFWILIDDIAPRLYGKEAVDKFLNR